MLRRRITLKLGSLIYERLYPMKFKQDPQSVPDRPLVLQIDPLLYKLIQGFYVDRRQGHAETPLNELIGHHKSHPLWYIHLIL